MNKELIDKGFYPKHKVKDGIITIRYRIDTRKMPYNELEYLILKKGYFEVINKELNEKYIEIAKIKMPLNVFEKLTKLNPRQTKC